MYEFHALGQGARSSRLTFFIFDMSSVDTQLSVLSVERAEARKHLAGTDFQLAKSDSLSPRQASNTLE